MNISNSQKTKSQKNIPNSQKTKSPSLRRPWKKMHKTKSSVEHSKNAENRKSSEEHSKNAEYKKSQSNLPKTQKTENVRRTPQKHRFQNLCRTCQNGTTSVSLKTPLRKAHTLSSVQSQRAQWRGYRLPQGVAYTVSALGTRG